MMSRASAKASTAMSSTSRSTPTVKARSISSLKRSRVGRRRYRVLMGGFLAGGGSVLVLLLMQFTRVCLGEAMLVRPFRWAVDRGGQGVARVSGDKKCGVG